MEEKYERYIPVEQSIIGSFKEIKAMREGKLPERSLEDFFTRLDAMVEEELMREQGNGRKTNIALRG